MKDFLVSLILILLVSACTISQEKKGINSEIRKSQTNDEILISKANYQKKLYGFWLGQCIANWTGLVTEMDKIGNVGEIKTGAFYTRNDWGKPDQPSIWAEGVPSDLSPTIDFVFRDTNEVWGADDDTDIEYMYQHLMAVHEVSQLSPKQIAAGWLKHIKPEEENYLWVSNQKAFDLMHVGMLPPATSAPENNEHFNMIDAQLTTEIFGLFAPGHPNVALEIARLPIQTTARKEAEQISNFYVTMYSVASSVDQNLPMNQRITWMAETAKEVLPEGDYPALMYTYIQRLHAEGATWEQARDSIYQRYQVEQKDGYDITSQDLYCNGCFAAGINFAASLVSLFYGEGDIVETIKIGTLCGWDSDNPTATWGGMLGFMLGKEGVEKAFGRTFSNQFNIHRTRQNFPNNGLDSFEHMATVGVAVTEKVVVEKLGGKIDSVLNAWIIPVQ